MRDSDSRVAWALVGALASLSQRDREDAFAAIRQKLPHCYPHPDDEAAYALHCLETGDKAGMKRAIRELTGLDRAPGAPAYWTFAEYLHGRMLHAKSAAKIGCIKAVDVNTLGPAHAARMMRDLAIEILDMLGDKEGSTDDV